jgi:hypothetical protein
MVMVMVPGMDQVKAQEKAEWGLDLDCHNHSKLTSYWMSRCYPVHSVWTVMESLAVR